ncbi:MAG: TetR/AcrR family transcriptional regulator C-terminal domain-containing protein [Pseudomonadota bacterium]
MAASQRRAPEERRQQIIDVAKRLFSERGYAKTSLEAILSQTGGSRRDIYDFFKDKQGLFDAVMHDLISTIVTESLVPGEIDFTDNIQSELERMGETFLKNMLSPIVVTTMRQFIAVATERQDLGKAAYKAGPAVLYEKFKTYLDQRVRRGDLDLQDTDTAARMFIEMLKGDYQTRALMTGDSGMTPDLRKKHVREVVRIFLYGALPRK